jgi:hypothetical protein
MTMLILVFRRFSCSSLACVLYLFVEMPEYYGCCGQFLWPSGDPPEDCEVSWSPSFEELSRTSHHRVSMRALVSWSASLLYRFCFVLKQQTLHYLCTPM